MSTGEEMKTVTLDRPYESWPLKKKHDGYVDLVQVPFLSSVFPTLCASPFYKTGETKSNL